MMAMAKHHHEKHHEGHMEREKHHEEHHAKGGAAGEEEGEAKKAEHPRPYNAQGSNVEKEAMEEEGHAKGGKVHKKKDGKKHHEHEAEGHGGRKRLDRGGPAGGVGASAFKRGGAVGSNLHPETTARHGSQATEHKTDTGSSDKEDD
jgi:hypothetical protein